MTIRFGNETVKILHTPGHTKGGACYIFENSRILFSGDTLFNLSAGRTDFPGGSAREELMSLSKLAKLEGDYDVYCGHGPDTTLEFERQNNRYVRIR
jgi:glyoxylase-like metal-dependent hydrolase (beta-lactamase superfamily II)